MPSYNKPPTISCDYRAVEIYRKAAEVIFHKGFNATSMADIADAVDLTKGGLYYYIKGKKALLFAVMSFALELLDAATLEARRHTDPNRKLAGMIAGHLKAVMRDPSTMSVLAEAEDHLKEDHRLKVSERKTLYVHQVRDVILDVQRERGTDPAANPSAVDATIAAQSVIGMIHWTVRWYDGPHTEDDYDRVAEQLTHLALGGLHFDRSAAAHH